MPEANGRGDGGQQAVYCKATFKGDNGENFNARAVYSPFSPASQRAFHGDVVAADPILADKPLRNAPRVKGSLVLILRGEVSFDTKMQHAVEAGACGVIFANSDNSLYLAEGTVTTIPSVMVDNETYQTLHGKTVFGGPKYKGDIDIDRLQSLAVDNKIEQALSQGRVCKLDVTVISGNNLKDMEFLFNMDPYVELRVGGQTRRTKTHREGGQNPIWNQKLRFNLTAKTPKVMSLTCFDEETLKAADLVGFNKAISLDSVLKNGMAELSVPLMDEESHPSGSIYVSMRVVIGKSPEERKQAKKGVKTMLDIQIEGATGLENKHLFGIGAANPFCKVTVAGVCKRTKTHKEGGEDPLWNQTVRMPAPRLGDGVDSKYMIVEVWDQGEGILGKDELLGKFETFDLTRTLENGDPWAGLIPLQPNGGKVKCRIDRVTEIHGQRISNLPSGPKKGIISRAASFLLAAAPFGLIATVPTLRAVVYHIGSHAVISLFHVVAALLPVVAGGIWWHRRTVVGSVVKGIVGRILGIGAFHDAGGGHLSFETTLQMSDLSLTSLLHFLVTGKATLRDVVIPNPCGFTSCVGTNAGLSQTMLRADTVYVHARLPTFFTPVKHVALLLVKNFELVITVDEGGKTNLQHVADNVGGFVNTLDRFLGKDIVMIHHLCLKSGTANLSASFLGQNSHSAVEIDKIDVVNIGKNSDADTTDTVLKRVYEELLLQASQTFHTRSKLTMHLNMDPEAEFGVSDSSADEDEQDAMELDAESSSEEEAAESGIGGSSEGETEEEDDTQPRHIAY
eukprot:CAMPEP_0173450872 /NCGR_PEP_ID=MMETSP1357-20121228/45612_1 /TAXON_ID=77926 /ORGANISM="Hemiselmis rufescens, Strain PCC563" /LENGTH=792 /DNA_ID=CAMNT_0014417581 /DNA_START=1 /DNA_END=2376 /DNA_ORIENTATION=-